MWKRKLLMSGKPGRRERNGRSQDEALLRGYLIFYYVLPPLSPDAVPSCELGSGLMLTMSTHLSKIGSTIWSQAYNT